MCNKQIAALRPAALGSISFEDFCLADERADWIERTHDGGVTVLHYPWGVLTRTSDGKCRMISFAEDLKIAA